MNTTSPAPRAPRKKGPAAPRKRPAKAPANTAATPAAPAVLPANTRPIQESIVLLVLTIHAPGNHRVVRDKSILQTEASKKRLSISKRLIKSSEHEFLQTMDGEIRSVIHSMALPSPFKSGTYSIPIALLQEVEGQLQDFSAKRRIAVGELKASYGAAKDRAREELGPLFREGDYLTPAELEAAYKLDWQYLTLAAPDALQGLDPELFARERERIQAQWNEVAGEMRDAMRVGLTEIVNDMVDRLADPDKRVKPTKLLERAQQFLSNFQARNITGDLQLEKLAEQAQSLLKGVNTYTLTQTDGVRTTVEKGFKAVQATLLTMETEARGKRRINFDEE